MTHLNFIEKIIEFKNGSLIAISTPATFGIAALLKETLKGLELKDLMMPLIVVFFTLFLFAGLFIQDFILGVKASRVKNKAITSKKKWRSFFKFFSVVILMFCMTVFDFLFLLAGLGVFYDAFLVLMIFIMVMVCLYEFHSIGENLKVIYDSKPKIFELFDKVAERVESGIMKRIEKYFL